MSGREVQRSDFEDGHPDDEGTTRIPEVRKAKTKEKRGHRRVDVKGNVTYKRTPTTSLMHAIQLGIEHSISRSYAAGERDILIVDFTVVETHEFPSSGGQTTPAHRLPDFKFTTYAPLVFRYFRSLYNIEPTEFLRSMCLCPLHELSSAGASGSVFYASDDDEFIIKTVSKHEADFLLKLLPGYFFNLNQNKSTLLPKFYGLFCYQSSDKNIRFVVMNNLLPTKVRIHEKYDLKGSTFKREASSKELQKPLPTLKDNDLIRLHTTPTTGGFRLEHEAYAALVKTLKRDTLVLQSFQIMDYSLLVGVYNIEQAKREQQNKRLSANASTGPRSTSESVEGNGGAGAASAPASVVHSRLNVSKSNAMAAAAGNNQNAATVQPMASANGARVRRGSADAALHAAEQSNASSSHTETSAPSPHRGAISLEHQTSEQLSDEEDVNNCATLPMQQSTTVQHYLQNKQRPSAAARHRVAQFTSPLEAINLNTTAAGHADSANTEVPIPPGGIPAWNSQNERLCIYLGIIDILQNYRLFKKVEHTVKAVFFNSTTISVVRPSFYSERFLQFVTTRVFQQREGGNASRTSMTVQRQHFGGSLQAQQALMGKSEAELTGSLVRQMGVMSLMEETEVSMGATSMSSRMANNLLSSAVTYHPSAINSTFTLPPHSTAEPDSAAASTACSAALTATSDSGVAGSSTLSEKDSVMRPKSSDWSTISVAGAGAQTQGQNPPSSSAALVTYRSSLVSPPSLRNSGVSGAGPSAYMVHPVHGSGLQLMPPSAGDMCAGSKNNLLVVEGANSAFLPSSQLRPGSGCFAPVSELSASAANLTLSQPSTASISSGAVVATSAAALTTPAAVAVSVARSSSASPAPARVKRGTVPESLANAGAVACAVGTSSPPISPLALEFPLAPDSDVVEMTQL